MDLPTPVLDGMACGVLRNMFSINDQPSKKDQYCYCVSVQRQREGGGFPSFFIFVVICESDGCCRCHSNILYPDKTIVPHRQQ